MKPKTFALAAVASLGLIGTAAQGTITVIDISNHVTGGTGGLPDDVISTFIGAGAHIIGATFDVQLETFGPSWASEASIALENTNAIPDGVSFNTNGVQTQPLGAIVNYTGGFNFQTGGPITNPDLSFFLGGDGMLTLTMFESYDDGVLGGDGFWHAGSTISVEWVIPTPGALALLGLAGLSTRRRRRA